mmetsp:Transcript_11193/g.18739  ORF Transcript_11193/g.18739 Transcript_11193/m.18739 type:complete len:306 (-) Transcript_11193:9-926(-)
MTVKDSSATTAPVSPSPSGTKAGVTNVVEPTVTPAPPSCAAGSAGCECDKDNACLAGLACVGDKCVVEDVCIAGETGCHCDDNNSCKSSRDECVADSCVRRSCSDGATACPCYSDDGKDPGLYPCKSMDDECVTSLYGFQCLPKDSTCKGSLGCACDESNPCDAPTVCGLDNYCVLQECEAGTVGCDCTDLGYCSESWSCIAGKCVESECSGSLACPCRKVDEGTDAQLGETTTLACDDGLKCASVVGNARGFCVLDGAVLSPVPSTSAPSSDGPATPSDSISVATTCRVSLLTLISTVAVFVAF